MAENNGSPTDPPKDEPKNEGKKRIECGFCECVLTPTGDYVSLSEKAKKFRDASSEAADWKQKYETLKANTEEKPPENKPADPPPSKTKGLAFSRKGASK